LLAFGFFFSQKKKKLKEKREAAQPTNKTKSYEHRDTHTDADTFTDAKRYK